MTARRRRQRPPAPNQRTAPAQDLDQPSLPQMHPKPLQKPLYRLLLTLQSAAEAAHADQVTPGRATRYVWPLWRYVTWLWFVGYARGRHHKLYCLASNAALAAYLQVSIPTLKRAKRHLLALKLLKEVRRYDSKKHAELTAMLVPGTSAVKIVMAFPQLRRELGKKLPELSVTPEQ